MPRKRRGKRLIPASTSSIDKLEKELEKAIYKHIEKDTPSNFIATQPISVLPKEGFYVLMMFRRGDKVTTKAFGKNITTQSIVEGVGEVFANMAEGLDNEKKIDIV